MGGEGCKGCGISYFGTSRKQPCAECALPAAPCACTWLLMWQSAWRHAR